MGLYRGSNRSSVDFIVRPPDPPKYDLETPLGTVKIGPFREGDEEGILQLFRDLFCARRNMDQWNWQYRDHPLGMHVFVGRLASGQVVSHFAGIPARTRVFDGTYVFSQVVDSMVDPRCRSGLKKHGLFKLTLLAHAYHYGRPDRELVQMGLPNPLAYRLGAQTCYYVPLTKCYAHEKRIDPDRTGCGIESEIKVLGETFEVAVLDHFPDDVGELWEKLKKRHGIISFRDPATLEWRYTKNPNWNYRIVAIRSSDGVLRGVAVTRSHWLVQRDLIIGDWLPDLDMEAASPALIKVCERLAAEDGMKRVLCILNHNAPESRVFEDTGYDLWKTPFRLVAHSYDPSFLTEDDILRHWYYTAGDFDVF